MTRHLAGCNTQHCNFYRHGLHWTCTGLALNIGVQCKSDVIVSAADNLFSVYMIAVQAVKTAPVFIGTGDPDPYVPVEREYALKTYKTWATPSASMKFNK
jgi:hypothetical protein